MSPKRYVGILTPVTTEYNLVWRYGLCRGNQIKSSHQDGSESNMTLIQDLDTDVHTGRAHMTMKAMTSMMLLQDKECQLLPVTHQKPGKRHGRDPSLESPEGTNPVETLLSDVQPPDL